MSIEHDIIGRMSDTNETLERPSGSVTVNPNSQENLQPHKKVFSRRTFLKGTAAITAGVALSGLPEIANAATPKEKEDLEPFVVHSWKFGESVTESLRKVQDLEKDNKEKTDINEWLKQAGKRDLPQDHPAYKLFTEILKDESFEKALGDMDDVAGQAVRLYPGFKREYREKDEAKIGEFGTSFLFKQNTDGSVSMAGIMSHYSVDVKETLAKGEKLPSPDYVFFPSDLDQSVKPFALKQLKDIGFTLKLGIDGTRKEKPFVLTLKDISGNNFYLSIEDNEVNIVGIKPEQQNSYMTPQPVDNLAKIDVGSPNALHPSQEKVLADGKERAMQIPETRIVVSTAGISEKYWEGLRKYQNDFALTIAGAKAKMGRPLGKDFNPDTIPTPDDTVFLGRNEADEKKFAKAFERLLRDLNTSAQKTSYVDQNGNIIETSLKGKNPYLEVLFYTQDNYEQDPETPKVLFSQKVDYNPNRTAPHFIREYNADDNVLKLYVVMNNSDSFSSFSGPMTQNAIRAIEWGFVKDGKAMKNFEKRGEEFAIKFACGYEYNPDGFQTGIIGPTSEKILYNNLFPELDCFK